MEGEVKSIRVRWPQLLGLLLFAALFLSAPSYAQEGRSGEPQEAAQLRLRKTPLKTREYQGTPVEGEEKVVAPGDSVWKFLIQERRLSEKRFGRYLVVIASLNPQIKNLNILRVGNTVFIPVRPDEILAIQVSSAKGQPKVYRVKQGDYLFKILREQFGQRENKEILSAYEQVKELNPRKKDWNILFVGEAVLFPGQSEAPKVAKAQPVETAKPTKPAKPQQVVELDHGRKLPAQENLQLLEQVIGALGNETQRRGEEVLPLREGTVRLDRNSFPIIHNPKMSQKVILDLGEKIPPALRTRLEAQSPNTPVVAVKKEASLHDAVTNLLSRLGFQFLPSNRPVVIQDRGVGLQLKGEWMVTAPEQLGGAPEMFIINLTDAPGETPEYLRSYLAIKGMNLKEILLPSSPLTPVSLSLGSGGKGSEVERWPADKGAMVDAFLKSYQVSFTSGHPITVSLREGIRMDTKADRFFEYEGRKVALFFQAVGEAVKKALQEKEGIRGIEMDLASLSSRQIISRLFEIFGERAAYRENRFPATEGGAKDKLVLTIPGFFVPERSLLLTDREIPKDLEPFFAEKGIKVAYFR